MSLNYCKNCKKLKNENIALKENNKKFSIAIKNLEEKVIYLYN